MSSKTKFRVKSKNNSVQLQKNKLGIAMTINQVKMAIYATYLTNLFGFKLKSVNNNIEKKQLRIEYAKTLLDKLNINVNVINQDKVPADGQYLMVSNHRSVIDPLIVELALEKSSIFGVWVSKKELYNSFFFGVFVRNGGSILLDREQKNMGGFFSDVKKSVKNGESIYMFPEGTRNKTDSTIGEFQGGSQVVALKNKLQILPVYIRTRAENILISSLKDGNTSYTIDIEIGDMIDPKDRSESLEDTYKQRFNLE